MLDTGSSTVHTFDTTDGAYVIHGAAADTVVFWYPALPVMGLCNYDIGQFNNIPSYGFDLEWAYIFYMGSWTIASVFNMSTGVYVPTWHGTNLNFFWTDNWRGITPDLTVLYVSNFFCALGAALLTDDPIWTLQNTTWTPLSYSPDALQNPTNVQPLTVTETTTANNKIIANFVQSARIVLTFRNRLILLNTIENNAFGATAFNPGSPTTTGITPTTYVESTNTQYKQRCRFSKEGNPFDTDAWLDYGQTYNPGSTGVVVAAGAASIDAATEDEILSAEFIKDRLIVFFSNSTWELAYTGNQLEPFVWQKLNTELGTQGPFSTIPFDKVILTLGYPGVHACNGSNVERIDAKIPDIIFDVQQQNLQPLRIQGIRDYFSECAWWTVPSTDQQSNQTYPGTVLVYNYQNNSWASNTDCITAFGYFFQFPGYTWEDYTDVTWEQADWPWDEDDSAQFRYVLAGNQQGFTFICDDDCARNAYAMQITNITTDGSGNTILTVIDNTIGSPEYLQITGTVGVTGLNGNIYIGYPIPASTTQIAIYQLNAAGTPVPAVYTGTYSGGGLVRRVSNIFIRSKEWNPYIQQGRDFHLAKIDFGVTRTPSGQVTIDYFTGDSTLSMVQTGTQTGSILGTSILETSPYALVPYEKVQKLLWHQIYFQTQGENIQIQFYMTSAQLTNPSIALSNFEVQGIVLHTQPTSQRLQ